MAPASVTHWLLKVIFRGLCRRVSWLCVAVVGDWTLSFLDMEGIALNTAISIQERMVPSWHGCCWQDPFQRIRHLGQLGQTKGIEGCYQADITVSDSGISRCLRSQTSHPGQPLLISPTCTHELQVCCQSVQRGGSQHTSIWLWTSFPISWLHQLGTDDHPSSYGLTPQPACELPSAFCSSQLLGKSLLWHVV